MKSFATGDVLVMLANGNIYPSGDPKAKDAVAVAWCVVGEPERGWTRIRDKPVAAPAKAARRPSLFDRDENAA